MSRSFGRPGGGSGAVGCESYSVRESEEQGKKREIPEGREVDGMDFPYDFGVTTKEDVFGFQT